MAEVSIKKHSLSYCSICLQILNVNILPSEKRKEVERLVVLES